MEDTLKKSPRSAKELALNRLKEMRQTIKRRRNLLEQMRIALKQQQSSLEAQQEWLEATRNEFVKVRPQRIRGL